MAAVTVNQQSNTAGDRRADIAIERADGQRRNAVSVSQQTSIREGLLEATTINWSAWGASTLDEVEAFTEAMGIAVALAHQWDKAIGQERF